MTNYNERLDDVLENIAQKMEKSCEEYFERTVLDSEYTESVDKTKDQAKQAIASLIKELVAEVLDSLESERDSHDADTGCSDELGYIPLSAIEAERNKLKEAEL